jgi:ATP sulfurylase
VEIWKRFRKWGGIPTGITQNVKDLLASKEVENIFEACDLKNFKERIFKVPLFMDEDEQMLNSVNN